VGTAQDKEREAAEYAALDHSESLDNALHALELEEAQRRQAQRGVPAAPDLGAIEVGCTVQAADRENFGTVTGLVGHGRFAKVLFVNNERETAATVELPLTWLTRVR
jgi:hypothetical protein